MAEKDEVTDEVVLVHGQGHAAARLGCYFRGRPGFNMVPVGVWDAETVALSSSSSSAPCTWDMRLRMSLLLYILMEGGGMPVPARQRCM
jgi:hypothetical protein